MIDASLLPSALGNSGSSRRPRASGGVNRLFVRICSVTRRDSLLRLRPRSLPLAKGRLARSEEKSLTVACPLVPAVGPQNVRVKLRARVGACPCHQSPTPARRSGEPILYPQSRARTVTTPPGCFNALFCASARASLQFQLRRVFPPVSGTKASLCLPDSCTALRSRPQSPFRDGRHQPPWLSRVVLPRTSKVRIFLPGRDSSCPTSSPTASGATRTFKCLGQLSLDLLTLIVLSLTYFGISRPTAMWLLRF